MIAPFASRAAPRLVFGPGALRDLPNYVRETGASAVFLVTDPGIARAGHVETARLLLTHAGVAVTVFDQTQENPTEHDVALCCEAARSARFECFIALGGGSSMDTAKACNFLLTNGGQMRDYHGYGKATRPMLPFIAIPTTSGTGSECQSYALVSRDDTHEKMACGDPKARAHIALLDPELAATQPRSVAVLTGLDALSHALESAVSTKKNPLSSVYAEASFRHLTGALGPILAGRATLDDFGHMQLGAALAGLAIENSMLGAAHAAANPLTARHHIIHGHAIGIMLPAVLSFNAESDAARPVYARFSEILREKGVSEQPLLTWVDDIIRACALPSFDRRVLDFSTLAHEASLQWTGKFNPRPLQPADFEALYQRAFSIDARA